MRLRVGGVLLFAAAVGVGCSDQPRTIKSAKAVQAAPVEKSLELPKGPPPATSDPASAAVVKAAVAAHTGNKPELLDKLKTVKLVRNGTFVSLQPPLQATWTVTANWPDRYRVDAELYGQPRITVSRVGDGAWMYAQIVGSSKDKLTEPKLREVISDDTYEWLLMLVPLADPGLVAAPFPDRDVAGKPATGVWLSGKNLPRAVAHFDKESKLLVQFTYEGYESNRPVVKEIVILSHRAVNGVMIPDKLAIKFDGQPAAEWSLTSMEFPVETSAKTFDEP